MPLALDISARLVFLPLPLFIFSLLSKVLPSLQLVVINYTAHQVECHGNELRLQRKLALHTTRNECAALIHSLNVIDYAYAERFAVTRPIAQIKTSTG